MNKLQTISAKVIAHMGPRYWWNPDPREIRPYHGEWHLDNTDNNFVRLATAINDSCPDMITEDDVEAGRAAARAHDFDQTCIYVQGPNGTMRKRFSGPIEGASAMWLATVMDEVGGFTPGQKETAVEAIMGTVPAWDAAKNRLIQPNLRAGVKLTTVLLALADLGGGVMGGASFAKEGRLVFTEDHLYVLDALLECKMSEVPANARFFAEKIVAYLGSQIGFLKGVADRLEEEMLPLVVSEARDPIRSCCTGTTAANRAAVEVYSWAQEMLEGGGLHEPLPVHGLQGLIYAKALGPRLRTRASFFVKNWYDLSMQKRHKIFIAINLPEDVKRALARYEQKFSELPAKWTPEDNLHITLVFLGDVTDVELGEVCVIVKEIAARHEVIDIHLNKIGYGPNEKLPPKMLWASGEKSTALSELKKELEEALLEKIVNFEPDNRGFTPHVTLARISAFAWRAINPEERPEVAQDVDLLFTAETIDVMESEMGKVGPKYTVLESMPLIYNTDV